MSRISTAGLSDNVDERAVGKSRLPVSLHDWQSWWGVVHRPYDSVKRLFDLVVATITLIASAPVLLLIAVCIKLTSRGPVLFRQQRIGQFGRPFSVYKFRTMVRYAEDLPIPIPERSVDLGRTIYSDPRLTRLGRFLRKTALDELPQLINVLQGSMSLVGPRPLWPADFDEMIWHHPRALFIRQTVRPGLTGAWQTEGRYNLEFSLEASLKYDVRYVLERSLLLDIRIHLRSIAMAFSGRYGY